MMSKLVISDNNELYLDDDTVLAVDKLTVEGELTGEGKLITDCAYIDGRDNIADTVEVDCTVDPGAIVNRPPIVYRQCIETFEAVSIQPKLSGGTVIHWKLKNSIKLIAPYYFTLQFAHSPTAPDEEWVDLKTTVLNYASDTKQRRFGQSNYVYYRVKLSEDGGSLITYSDAYAPMGEWTFREWALYRAIGRSERRRMMGRTGINGLLYKRRVYGEICPRCTDYQSGVVSDGNCPICLGTGFVGGYYPPLDCVWAEITQQSMRESLDLQGRGTVNDQTIKGRFFAEYDLNTNDIWISKNTGEYYAVQEVTNVEELRGIPVIYQAELRLIPPTDIVYTLPLTLEKYLECNLYNSVTCTVTGDSRAVEPVTSIITTGDIVYEDF